MTATSEHTWSGWSAPFLWMSGSGICFSILVTLSGCKGSEKYRSWLFFFCCSSALFRSSSDKTLAILTFIIFSVIVLFFSMAKTDLILCWISLSTCLSKLTGLLFFEYDDHRYQVYFLVPMNFSSSQERATHLRFDRCTPFDKVKKRSYKLHSALWHEAYIICSTLNKVKVNYMIVLSCLIIHKPMDYQSTDHCFFLDLNACFNFTRTNRPS